MEFNYRSLYLSPRVTRKRDDSIYGLNVLAILQSGESLVNLRYAAFVFFSLLLPFISLN